VSHEHPDHDPAAAEQGSILDHAYDGIQEYDNPLPRWWLAIFWLTIVFSPLYILYFHFGGGLLATEKYDAEMVAYYDRQAEQLLALGDINEKTLVDLTADTSMMNSGKKIFQTKCATCHGMFGEGGIGPNLTDQYWLHGAQLMNIYATVRDGVPAKGMLSWERQLRPAELMAVAAYVSTLLDSNPHNPKPPQGQLTVRVAPTEGVEAEAAADQPAADSGTATTES
jgi:cytochrome c oxidase cbb3-type subunit 3